MKKVKMLKTVDGSPDGITINKYNSGEIYELPERLYNNFVVMKVVEDYKEVKEEPKIEKKKEVKKEEKKISSYENKAVFSKEKKEAKK